MKKWLQTFGVAAGIAVLAVVATPASAEMSSLKPVVNGISHDYLYGIGFYKNTGVAVGAYGQVMVSEDTGKTWKNVPAVPTDRALLGVGLTQGHAIIVGQDGVVLVRDEQGKWQKVDSGTKERLFNVAVQPDGVAVAVGSYGTILESRDSGHTWHSIAPKSWDGYAKYDDKPHIYAVNVDAKDVITVAGEFGLILRSTDNGANWKIVNRGNQDTHVGDASLFSMQIRPDGVGYAVGQIGTILRTADGGLTWQAVNKHHTGVLLGVQSQADGRVVVTGMHTILISKDDGKTWQQMTGLAATSQWFEGIASTAPDGPMLTVGASGRIVQVVDG